MCLELFLQELGSDKLPVYGPDAPYLQASAEDGKVRSQLQSGARRLRAASVVSEADIGAENPAMIGLISMFTGLTNLEDIERVHRQLWLRGKQILSGSQLQGGPNQQIINLLEQSDGRKGVTG